jgi:hypothetical protein
MELDHSGYAEIDARGIKVLQVGRQDRYLGQCVVPLPGLEEQLAPGAVCLNQPDRRAYLAGQVHGLTRDS